MGDCQVLSELPEHAAPRAHGRLRVSVGGKVERALDLDAGELAEMPQVSVTEDFVCEEGWRVPGQSWQGVLVGHLLDAVGVHGEGLWVEFGSGDFCFSEPVDKARAGLVALQLNGAPVTPAHGGPCRLYLPGEACYTSVKWLDRIEVRDVPGPNEAERIARQRLVGAERGTDGD